MSGVKLSRATAISAVFGLTVALTVGLSPTVSNAATMGANVPAVASAPSASAYRQLVGTVSGPALFESSVPVNGTYAFEYAVTDGIFAAFDTYVDGVELGYTGGVPGGVYRSRAVALNAGGHLVQIAGPEGSGTAKVYIVQVG